MVVNKFFWGGEDAGRWTQRLVNVKHTLFITELYPKLIVNKFLSLYSLPFHKQGNDVMYTEENTELGGNHESGSLRI